jgi:5-amino-6-(5-phospho-D-ribitylamino)uracil phosphatase
MIAIDLDGTLLSPAGQVTPRTRAAVHNALKAGLLVCFATGRNFTESLAVLQSVGHYDSAVFVGGAMVIDTQKRLTLHRTLMDADLARQLCGFFETRGHAVLALQDTGRAGVDYLISKQIAANDATRQWLDVTTASVHWTENLPEQSHEHTIRLGIVCPGDAMREVHRELLETFGSRVVSHILVVPAYGVEVLEVFDPAVNKWEGVLHIARRYGVEATEIIAIGDDVNDIPMIKNAGLGVAMGNALPEVRSAAEKIIGTNRDEGLAAFLEELVKNDWVEKIDLGPEV